MLNPHKTRPLKGRFTHSMPCPCRAVNSHMPCRAPAMLRQCSVLCESPRGSQKYPNSWSNSLTDRLFCSVLLPLFTVVVRRTGMLLITIFVELGVVAGRSRTWAGRPQAVSRRPRCAVALRRTAWSEHDMGATWAWHGKCESDTAALCKSNGKDPF